MLCCCGPLTTLSPPVSPVAMVAAKMAVLKGLIFVVVLFGDYGSAAEMVCNQGSCYTSEWCQCPLTTPRDCVKPDWICDGMDDCDNGEDERDCGVTTKATTSTSGNNM